MPFRKPKLKVEPIRRWKIVVGDEVQLITGSEKGKKGKVTDILRDLNKVIVAGVNLTKRYIKSDGTNKGGVYMKESPVHVSNVSLIDPVTGKPCKVGWRFLEDGTKVRVSRKSGALIPKPPREPKKLRGPGPADTPAELVLKQTYDPTKEKRSDNNTPYPYDLNTREYSLRRAAQKLLAARAAAAAAARPQEDQQSDPPAAEPSASGGSGAVAQLSDLMRERPTAQLRRARAGLSGAILAHDFFIEEEARQSLATSTTDSPSGDEQQQQQQQ